MSGTPQPNTPPTSGSGARVTDPRNMQFGSFGSEGNTSQANPEVIMFGNPLYLNPNENLSLPIVSELMDGNNYSMWSRSVLNVLKTKHKMGFVDGSLPRPAITDPQFHLWDGCNTVVLTWILNSVNKDIRRSVMRQDNAKVLWDELKRRFGQLSANRMINLKDEIHKCKQGNLTITQYYTQIKGLWDEYTEYNPIVACNCLPGNTNPCTAVEAFERKQETDYLIRSLRGLNPDYEIIKKQLLMLKPLPTVTIAVDDLLQYEQELKARGGTKKGQSVALAVGGEGTRDNEVGDQGQGKKFCRFCKRNNHYIEECWRLKKKKDDAEKEGKP
ncbi:unnamed protein product [Linum trigynum]|uniref:Retrotransposon Copia-like N-terminal domain-containing protein n=1 Tax=Linum trigynum TaxID=586398 RepID=A0AAV2FAT8_9ROSI